MDISRSSAKTIVFPLVTYIIYLCNVISFTTLQINGKQAKGGHTQNNQPEKRDIQKQRKKHRVKLRET